MNNQLDGIAPNYRVAVERWPDAPTLQQHYRAVAEAVDGSGHGLIETVKSFVECVCLTILGEFGRSMPSSSPSTTELVVEALSIVGLRNTRGASRLDRVLSSYNRLADALTECRNEDGPIAHGKDGFLDTLRENQLRTYLLTGDALVALLVGALDGTEPDLRYTRVPYEQFSAFHDRLDACVSVWADAETNAGSPVFVLGVATSTDPNGVELRVEPSRLLYALDRDAYLEILSTAMTEEVEAVADEVAEPSDRDMPVARSSDVHLEPLFTTVYQGDLNHLAANLAEYLRQLDLDPTQTAGDSESRLLPTVLQTAEQFMQVDWTQREDLLSRMRVALRRVLHQFDVPRADSKSGASHIVTWLRIQLSGESTGTASGVEEE